MPRDTANPSDFALAALEGIDEAIFVVDPETYELLWTNSACQKTWGDDLIGRPCHEALRLRSEPCPGCTNDTIFGDHLGKSHVWEFHNEVNGNWYRCSHKAIGWTDGRMVRFTMATDITERKKAESALAQQRDMFELVINSAPINIFWKDTNSIYLGCNTTFARANGAQDAAQLVGKNDFDMIWGKEAQKYIDDDRQVMSSGRAKLRYDEYYIKPDGSREWWRTSKIPLKNKAGTIIGVLALSEVTTLQKQAETELRASEKRFRALFEQAGDYCMVLDPHTADGIPIILDANKAAAAIHGYTREEFIGRPVNDVDDADGRRRCRWRTQQIMTGSPFFVENTHVRKDGSTFHVAVHANRIDIEGEPPLIFTTEYDITDRKRAEEELRESETKFRNYIEQAPYGVFIADATGRYLDVNPAASKITGYTRDELLAMNIGNLATPDGREAGAAHFARLAEQGHSEGVLPFVQKDGTRGLWNVTAVRLSDDRFLGFVQDVTQHELLEEQVRQSQKLDAVGQLAGGVAHDFNNMLMGIMGYAELCLQQIGEDHKIGGWIKEILKASHRSADIVRQLLAFSRKQTIAPKILDLNDTVANMLKMLRRLIGEDIDLLWQPSADLCSVKMDPGQVDQILANLCVNARDAIGGVGKVTIETANVTLDAEYCATHTEVDPGEFLMLAVSDNGCGMDKKTMANIFEPFFTTKAEGYGTGLGLATVYGIVKQNNGSINVYSEPGEGTTFRIYFPCHEEPIR